ncbi:MAG: hypothetical protein IJH81_08035 [Lachnospiraceae bacterium]|nr:hypothetical protein [Lachnospiraceae bacterium]
MGAAWKEHCSGMGAAWKEHCSGMEAAWKEHCNGMGAAQGVTQDETQGSAFLM